MVVYKFFVFVFFVFQVVGLRHRWQTEWQKRTCSKWMANEKTNKIVEVKANTCFKILYQMQISFNFIFFSLSNYFKIPSISLILFETDISKKNKEHLFQIEFINAGPFEDRVKDKLINLKKHTKE